MRRLALVGLCGMLVLLSGCGPSTAELSQRGATQFQMGDTEAARETLQLALDRNPSDPQSLYYMGRVEFAEGFYEHAAYYFRCAIDAGPGLEDARVWLAKAQEAMDRAR